MSVKSDPASGFAAVTKSDTIPLPTTSRALYVGTSGNLAVKGRAGTTVTFVGVPAGTVLPIEAVYVMAATTAADIVAMF